ncbi:MAG: DUF427 domain-containing protein [Solirubrobacterales bacterium]|nr:DUF427 domain-containing protein [Solirubrobacterales bacterium]
MESVWDYPRPPAVEACPRHVRVELAGQILADSDHALRVLETSHPPTIYLPRGDVRVDLLVPSRRRSTWCEFKGAARYLDALIGNRVYGAVAWTYPEPSPGPFMRFSRTRLPDVLHRWAFSAPVATAGSAVARRWFR